MFESTVYINRRGELIWFFKNKRGTIRNMSVVRGLCITELDTTALDGQKPGQVIELAPDLMSGKRVDWSTRRKLPDPHLLLALFNLLEIQIMDIGKHSSHNWNSEAAKCTVNRMGDMLDNQDRMAINKCIDVVVERLTLDSLANASRAIGIIRKKYERKYEKHFPH